MTTSSLEGRGVHLDRGGLARGLERVAKGCLLSGCRDRMSPLVEKDAMTERGPEPPKNNGPEPTEPEARERATGSRDTLLTRSEAAAVLGRHASSVRRLEKKSRLVAELARGP